MHLFWEEDPKMDHHVLMWERESLHNDKEEEDKEEEDAAAAAATCNLVTNNVKDIPTKCGIIKIHR